MKKDYQKIIAGKTVNEWMDEVPIILDIIEKRETVWLNPKLVSFDMAISRYQGV